MRHDQNVVFINIIYFDKFTYSIQLLARCFISEKKSSVMSNRLYRRNKMQIQMQIIRVCFILFVRQQTKSVLYETDDLWEICVTGAEELFCLGRIVYSCLMNEQVECSIKNHFSRSLDFSTNLNILLIFSSKLEVKLS